jgi:hypothetical protein
MTMLAAIILICVCCIVLGAVTSKPIGWAVVGLAVLALLLAVLGGVGIHVGK